MRHLDTIKINRLRLEKKISITEIAKHLGCSYSNVWLNFSGEHNNEKLLTRSKEYIDSVNPHFRNLGKKEFNNTSLKRLGFSKWEIEQILN
tara:strand:- start:1794 stop:2066 length:273 start_codon:yes stop_codon:yes gene_type:complete